MMPLFIFLDISNIFITAQRLCEVLEPQANRYALRLNFEGLVQIAHAGRPVSKLYVIGSRRVNQQPQWIHTFNSDNFHCPVFCRTLERVNDEQGVDQYLQLLIYRTLHREEMPGTLVLLTGDGSPDEEEGGFIETLSDASSLGWGIEVLSWNRSCNSHLKSFAKEHGVFVSLDEFYSKITYIQGARYSNPLRVTRSQFAVPKKTVLTYFSTADEYHIQNEIDMIPFRSAYR